MLEEPLSSRPMACPALRAPGWGVGFEAHRHALQFGRGDRARVHSFVSIWLAQTKQVAKTGGGQRHLEALSLTGEEVEPRGDTGKSLPRTGGSSLRPPAPPGAGTSECRPFWVATPSEAWLLCVPLTRTRHCSRAVTFPSSVAATLGKVTPERPCPQTRLASESCGSLWPDLGTAQAWRARPWPRP